MTVYEFAQSDGSCWIEGAAFVGDKQIEDVIEDFCTWFTEEHKSGSYPDIDD